MNRNDESWKALLALVGEDDPVLKKIRKKAEPLGLEDIQITRLEGLILQLLVRLHKPQRVVELGTLVGYSAVTMARVMPTGAFLHTVEIKPEHAQLARESLAEAQMTERVQIHEGDADLLLNDLSAHGPFDFIFLDANKSGYFKALKWAEKNLNLGGLVVADNALQFGAILGGDRPEKVSKAQWESLQNLHSRLQDQRWYQGAFLPTATGLSVALLHTRPTD